MIDELLARRVAAGERFFAAEAERVALLGLGAALAALQLPELKRYMKMRSM